MNVKTLMINLMVILLTSCTTSQPPTTVPVSTEVPQANMPNPAAAYCEQKGYRVEMRIAEDGSRAGYCVFPSGSECNEWAYFRGECGPEEQYGSTIESTGDPEVMSEIGSQSTSIRPPAGSGTLTAPAMVVTNEPLDYCFSYPQGYTQIPYNDAVEIVAPDLPGSDVRGLFWLEISDSYDRTAEEIADQEMTYAAGLNVGRWTVMLDGEQAVVLDGMPGQDFQRRVYVVHQQTLYVLAFMPTRSGNKAASDQMEALFATVTSSWVWMSSGKSCPADN